MMTYRERRQAKAERLREWAEKRDAKAEAAREKVDQITDMIPMGQPILVGHHSEGRHRRDIDRMERGMRTAIDNQQTADRMRERAANIEAAAGVAIYSDDSDAIPRLEAKIAGLEAERARITAYNKSCRKGQPDESLLDEGQRKGLAGLRRFGTPFIRPDGSMPAYQTSNLSGNLSRLRKRLEQLRRERDVELMSVEQMAEEMGL